MSGIMLTSVVIISTVMILVVDNILEKQQVTLPTRKKVAKAMITFSLVLLIVQVLISTYHFLSQR